MDTEALPTTGLPTLRRADGSPGEWVLGDDVSIGRPEGRPTVALDDSTVSRRHASISYREGRWWIADQGSTNGTFVNGARVTTAELHSGDAVRLGRVDLAFTVGAPGTTGSPASAGPSYTVGSQSGTVNNVGANQYNYNRRGSLEWIATKKAGRGMIWAGVIMLFLGMAVGVGGILFFDANLTQAAQEGGFPAQTLIAVGAGGFLEILGLFLIVAGILSRRSARKEWEAKYR